MPMGEQRRRRIAAVELPRGPVLAKTRVAPGPTDRSKGCLHKQSSQYIRKVQCTVLSVAGLKVRKCEPSLNRLRPG